MEQKDTTPRAGMEFYATKASIRLRARNIGKLAEKLATRIEGAVTQRHADALKSIDTKLRGVEETLERLADL